MYYDLRDLIYNNGNYRFPLFKNDDFIGSQSIFDLYALMIVQYRTMVRLNIKRTVLVIITRWHIGFYELFDPPLFSFSTDY